MNKKVLVLEDEDNIRAFVVINLKRAGYETVEFGLGEEAANYLKDNNDVSIAVLDVMLPDITGFDVCRRIRGMGSLFDNSFEISGSYTSTRHLHLV